MINFKLVYQPKVCDGKTIAAEALIRPINTTNIELFVKSYHDPVGLDLAVVKKVLSEIRTFGVDILISINVSYFSLVDPDFISLCIEEFKALKICLELTEYNEITDYHTLKENVILLQSHGVFVALDDFGKDYSKVNVITEVQFNQVKFDKTLIDDIECNFNKYKHLRFLSEKIKTFGVTDIVYEGVETEQQEALIRVFDPHATIQGYLYSRPVPIEELLKRDGLYHLPKKNSVCREVEGMERLVYDLVVSNGDKEVNNKIESFDLFSRIYSEDPNKTIDNYTTLYHSRQEESNSVGAIFSIVNNSERMMVIRDNEGVVIYENKKHEQFFGRSLVGLKKESVIDIFKDYGLCLVDDALLLNSRDYFSVKKELFNNASYFTIRQKVSFNNELFVLVTVYEEKRGFFVNKDPLTGCDTRDCIDQIKKGGLYSEKIVAFLDLNGFKNVNDTLGHSVGDYTLKLVAEILTQNLRVSNRDDTIIRYGGDEFLILFNSDSLENVDSKLKDINTLVIDSFKEKNISLSFSYGLAINEGNDIEIAIAQADNMMYKFKKRR